MDRDFTVEDWELLIYFCGFRFRNTLLRIVDIFSTIRLFGGRQLKDDDEIKNALIEILTKQGHSSLSLSALIHKRTWESRTARLAAFRVSDDDSDDVLVKIFKDTETPVARWYQLYCEANTAVCTYSANQAEGIDPIAFIDQPPVLIMPLKPGLLLDQTFGLFGWRLWGRSSNILKQVYKSGAGISSYHRYFQNESAFGIDDARVDLRRRISSLGCSTNVYLDHFSKVLVVSRKYVDFHAGHVIVAGGKGVSLLDPPIEPRYAFTCVDISRFLHNLFVDLMSPRNGLGIGVAVRTLNKIETSLLAGYCDTRGVELSDDERAAIAMCQLELLRRVNNRYSKHSASGLKYRVLSCAREKHLSGIVREYCRDNLLPIVGIT